MQQRKCGRHGAVRLHNDAELVREVGQDLVAVLGDDDEILEPAAAEAAPVAARLDRDDVAGDQLVAAAGPCTAARGPRARRRARARGSSRPRAPRPAPWSAGSAGRPRCRARTSARTAPCRWRRRAGRRRRGRASRASAASTRPARRAARRRRPRTCGSCRRSSAKPCRAARCRPPPARRRAISPEPESCPIADCGAVGDDRVVGQLAAVLLGDRLHRGAHLLGGQPGPQLADQRRGDAHRRVGGLLGAPDAVELERRLDAAAAHELVVVDGQLDARPRAGGRRRRAGSPAAPTASVMPSSRAARRRDLGLDRAAGRARRRSARPGRACAGR